MNEEQRIQYNASQNGISIEHQREVEKYMAMPMNEWPEDLVKIGKRMTAKLGFCGEILVAACVEYVTGVREI